MENIDLLNWLLGKKSLRKLSKGEKEYIKWLRKEFGYKNEE